MSVTLTAFFAAVILGLIFGLMRVSANPVFTNISTLYVEVIRGIPLLVLLLLVHFAFPPWLRENFPPAAPYLMVIVGIISVVTAIYYFVNRWPHRNTEPIQFIQPVALSLIVGVAIIGLLFYALAQIPPPTAVIRTPPFQSAILGLAICYGAFLAELFRAGIQSIGRGQMEAARSLGMNYIQAMRYVILPQAFRVVLPPLGNEFIAMLKDSSLIAILTVAEMTYKAQIFAASVFRTFEPYITIAVLYLCMTLFLSLMVRVVERRVQLPR
jgi:polar amino acid transport system permease protein